MKNTYYYQVKIRDIYTGKLDYIYTPIRYIIGAIIGNFQVLEIC